MTKLTKEAVRLWTVERSQHPTPLPNLTEMRTQLQSCDDRVKRELGFGLIPAGNRYNICDK